MRPHSARAHVLAAFSITLFLSSLPARAVDAPDILEPPSLRAAFVPAGGYCLTLDPFVVRSPPASTSSTPAPASMPAPTSSAPLLGSLESLDNLSPDVLYACACGCGVFEVGTDSMLPHGQGGMIWEEWDYQDQKHNRHGASSAPSADNDDKDLRSSFFTTGAQYFFDRSWGVEAEVPLVQRSFTTTDATYDWAALGDVRLKGLYTGFSPDQSLGVSFGVKLPTGDWKHSGPDRDTQIGTGSTDLLLGGFFRNHLSADGNWTLFTQLEADVPVLIQDHYRPGAEVDGAVGVYYSGFSFQGVTIVPVGQIIATYRSSDSGENAAHPVASGYERLFLSPGVEFNFQQFTLYGDVEIPVLQSYIGDQLAAPALFKVILAWRF